MRPTGSKVTRGTRMPSPASCASITMRPDRPAACLSVVGLLSSSIECMCPPVCGLCQGLTRCKCVSHLAGLPVRPHHRLLEVPAVQAPRLAEPQKLAPRLYRMGLLPWLEHSLF